jgi:hypothetical protein
MKKYLIVTATMLAVLGSTLATWPRGTWIKNDLSPTIYIVKNSRLSLPDSQNHDHANRASLFISDHDEDTD